MAGKKTSIIDLEMDLINPSLDRHENYARMEKAAKELERFRELLEMITYTAKRRKEIMHKYRKALEGISKWSEEVQEEVIKKDAGLEMWRGCIAEAKLTLDEVDKKYYPKTD